MKPSGHNGHHVGHTKMICKRRIKRHDIPSFSWWWYCLVAWRYNMYFYYYILHARFYFLETWQNSLFFVSFKKYNVFPQNIFFPCIHFLHISAVVSFLFFKCGGRFYFWSVPSRFTRKTENNRILAIKKGKRRLRQKTQSPSFFTGSIAHTKKETRRQWSLMIMDWRPYEIPSNKNV